MSYEAILFDFDGVLVDSEPVHFACWRDILREFDLQLDWQVYCEHGIGKPDRDLMTMLCQQKNPPLDVERLLAQYPRKKDMFRSAMLARQAFTPDVKALLAELRDYQLGVVTSSGQGEVEPILQQAGVLERFRARIYGGDVKRHKPAPDPYLLAIERLAVKRALVLEDSAAGETSARAAGLDVLRVRTSAEMPGLLREKLANRRSQ